MEKNLQTEAAELLVKKGMTLAVAESCTGGMIASGLIEFAGISEVLIEGCVTYSNDAKVRRLGVKEETLAQYGAVSPQTAKEMAEGIAGTSGADIGLATTGIAGPGGGTEEKPVGLVYIGISCKGKTEVFEHHFSGGRQEVREAAAAEALQLLRKALSYEE